MSKKKRQVIDKKACIKLFEEGYGFSVQEMNDYQFRLRSEEHPHFFDWYHTSGTLVSNIIKYGEANAKGMGQFMDCEDAALKIKEILCQLRKLQ